ncbi:MAG: serine hydrolase [Planctomycetes bacterium]|nr:serine hydrolase [Planctomycetota bacterium]
MVRLFHLVLTIACLLGGAAAQFGYDTVTYHGVSGAVHQTNINNLSGQGYRMISLAVAGDLLTANYSAVWLRQTGSVWVTAHGMTHSQLLSQDAVWDAQGYRPKLITASGVGGSAVFAAIYVNDGVDAVLVDDLTGNGLYYAAQDQRNAGRRMVSCGTYTTSNQLQRFMPVFEAADDVDWGLHFSDANAFGGDVAAFADAECRPAFLATHDQGLVVSVWHDDKVGGWAWVSERTAAQFAADELSMQASGLAPLCVAARGSGANARFAGLFVQRLTAYPRTLSRTGLARLSMVPFDAMMENEMVARRVRNASIAVIKDGRLVHARGYTFAEAGQPQTTPVSLFRTGSISKALTGMVAHDCIQHGVGGLQLDTTLWSKLPQFPAGSGITGVKLRHLLNHTSGMTQDFSELDAAAWFANGGPLVLPPDETTIVRYAMTSATVDFGSYVYNNVGAAAAGCMVEAVTGQDYAVALQQRLLSPLGITRFGIMSGPSADLLPGEMRYHLAIPYLRTGNLDAAAPLMAPQYCQHFWDSAGGVVTSAVDLARVIAGSFQIGADSPVFPVSRQDLMLQRRTFTSPGGSPRTVTDSAWHWKDYSNGDYTFWHDGAQDGFKAMAMFRPDGIGVVVMFNGDYRVSLDQIEAAIDAITTWPTDDQFPVYGLPSFPRTPQFGGFSLTSLSNVTRGSYLLGGEALDQVTHATFVGQTLLPGTPTAWAGGYLELVSPTVLRVHPPQGLAPGVYPLQAFSAQGASNIVMLTVTHAPTFVCQSPEYVIGGAMPFAVIAGRGAMSDLSWVALAFSQSSQPSVAPGIVSLDLGAAFSDFFASDLVQFSSLERTVRWDFAGLSGYQGIWFQCAAIDLLAPSLFPLDVCPPIMMERH